MVETIKVKLCNPLCKVTLSNHWLKLDETTINAKGTTQGKLKFLMLWLKLPPKK